MSLPHKCVCRVCGYEMAMFPSAVFPRDPSINAAQGGSLTAMKYVCTKHGYITGPDCEICIEEQRANKSESSQS